MSNYLTKLLFKVLKAYNVSVTYRTIEREVNTHPKYPSMQCISDALDGWKVKNVVMNLTVEKLHALDVPVIAHLKKGELIIPNTALLCQICVICRSVSTATNCSQIDLLARKAMWEHGVNYGHGTGHGVGHYLNVHEGPHSWGGVMVI